MLAQSLQALFLNQKQRQDVTLAADAHNSDWVKQLDHYHERLAHSHKSLKTPSPQTTPSSPETANSEERIELPAGIFIAPTDQPLTITPRFNSRDLPFELGVVNLRGMERFAADPQAFVQEAVRRVLSQSELGYHLLGDERALLDLPATDEAAAIAFGSAPSAIAPPTLPAGDTFTLLMSPQGAIADLPQTPELEPIFAFLPGAIADITGQGQILSLASAEDHRHHNLVLQIEGATVAATAIDALLPEGQHWQETKWGQFLVSGLETLGDRRSQLPVHRSPFAGASFWAGDATRSPITEIETETGALTTSEHSTQISNQALVAGLDALLSQTEQPEPTTTLPPSHSDPSPLTPDPFPFTPSTDPAPDRPALGQPAPTPNSEFNSPNSEFKNPEPKPVLDPPPQNALEPTFAEPSTAQPTEQPEPPTPNSKFRIPNSEFNPPLPFPSSPFPPNPEPTNPEPQNGIFTADETGQVSFDYLYDGGAFRFEMGIFSLEGMDLSQSHMAAFQTEALRRVLSQSEQGEIVIRDRTQGAKFSGQLRDDFNAGEYTGPKTLAIQPGSQFAMLLAPNSTLADFQQGKGKGKLIFSLDQPAMVDITGQGHTFGFEDLDPNGKKYDGDFNDAIFQVRGATTTAPTLAERNQTWWDHKPQAQDFFEILDQDSTITTHSDRFFNPNEDFSLIGRADRPELIEQVEVWVRDRHDGDWTKIETITELDAAGRFQSGDGTELDAGNYEVKTVTHYTSGLTQTGETRDFTVLSLPEGEGLSDRVKTALLRAINLNNYDPKQLAQTTDWVVSLQPGTDVDALAQSLGFQNLGSTGQIPNTYRWSHVSGQDATTVQTAIRDIAGIEFAYPLVTKAIELHNPWQEPLVEESDSPWYQWHLAEGDVVSTWKPEALDGEDITGSGVQVGVLDMGFEVEDAAHNLETHPDLDSNYRADLSHDYDENDDAPSRLLTHQISLNGSQYPIFDIDEIDTYTNYNRFQLYSFVKGAVEQFIIRFGIEDYEGNHLKFYLVDPVLSDQLSDEYYLDEDDLANAYLLDSQQGSGIHTYTIEAQDIHHRKADGDWSLIILESNSSSHGQVGRLTHLSLDLTTHHVHGTNVAGVVAAEANGVGGVGVAPDAEWAAIRVGANGIDDLKAAAAFNHRSDEIDIYQNSWGVSNFFSTLTDAQGDPTSEWAIENNAEDNNSIYVFSAGNSNEIGGRVDYNAFASSRHTIAVGALTRDNQTAPYSSPGSSLFISAYSSDQLPPDGIDDIATTSIAKDPLTGEILPSYTNRFGGTSAAAPFVSGVIALMLEARPELTWRDVQHILAQTADRTHLTAEDWTPERGGVSHSHQYGFGRIDPLKAVQRAKTWDLLAPEVQVLSPMETVSTVIEDYSDTHGASPLTSTITIAEDIIVESVEVVFHGDHHYRGDLKIVLTSPSGVQQDFVSVLSERHGRNGRPESSYRTSDHNWTFTSLRHWGESAQGDWTLEVVDLYDDWTADQGYWTSWSLNLYGADATNTAPTATNLDQVHEYTEGQALQLTPIVVADADGDTLSVVLSLSDAAAGTLKTGALESNGGVLQLDGSAAEVSAALAALVFTPADGFEGNLAINTSVTDGRIANPLAGLIELTAVPLADVFLYSGSPYSSEDGALGSFLLVRSGSDITQPLTIEYSISGTAENGSDYELTQTITLNAYESSRFIQVRPIDDDVYEGLIPETMTVELVAGSGYATPGSTSHTISIVDNDSAPEATLQVLDDTASEDGNAGRIAVQLDRASSQDTVVNYTLAGATEDIAPLSGSVVVRAGEQFATFGISALHDYAAEGEESVVITLAGGTGYSLGTAVEGTVVIEESTETFRYGPFVYEYGGKQYLLSQPDSWHGAQSQAEALGGNLVSINDQAENDWLVETFGVFPDKWIGFTDSSIYGATEGNYQWINGEDSAYTNWHSDAPNNDTNNSEGSEDFTHLGYHLTGQWNDLPSNFGNGYHGIIEIDPSELSKPIVNVMVTDDEAGEDGNAGQIVFTRVGDLSQDLTVNYSLGGDATNGVDYAGLTGSVVIPAGQTLVTLPILAINDDQLEAGETVVLALAAGDYEVGLHSTGQVTIEDNESGFGFESFSAQNTDDLNFLGVAETVEDKLRITPDTPFENGTVWHTEKQDVGQGFETTFTFQITKPEGTTGADGFAFHIQNHSDEKLGRISSFIPNDLAIEFDTFNNVSLQDPNDNHISVHTRGTETNSGELAYSLGYTTDIPNLSDDQPHDVKVRYVPGTLEIFLDDFSSPVLTVDVDLENTLALDAGKAWVGFTSGTGAAWEVHDILDWSFTSTDTESQPTIYTNPETGNQYFLTTADTWLGAQEQAEAAGGNLVTVNDATENQWLVDTFGIQTNRHWIGFNDSPIHGNTEGDFSWVSGEVGSFTNWHPEGEPNNTTGTWPEGEDFTHTAHDAGEYPDAAYWNDLGLSSNLFGVRKLAGIVELPGTPNDKPTLQVTPIQQWVQKIGSGAGNLDVATDSQGNVYAVGYAATDLNDQSHSDPFSQRDAQITKHDADGNLLWTRILGTLEEEQFMGISVDASDNVGIIGHRNDGQNGTINVDGFFAKYDSEGNLLTEFEYDTGIIDEFRKVTIDVDGNFYAAGYVSDQSVGHSLLVKIDNDGNVVWSKQLDPAQSQIIDIVYDATNQLIYTAGASHGGSRLSLYDLDGNVIWDQAISPDDTNSLHTEAVYALALDDQGNAYVSGHTRGTYEGEINQGESDIFVAKYDSQGQQLWAQQFGTAGHDIGQGISVDSHGYVYVSGQLEESPGVGSWDGILKVFDNDGNELPWSASLSGQSWDAFTHMNWDEQNNLYLIGDNPSGLGGHALFKYNYTQTYQTNTPLDLTTITVNDADADTLTVTLTLSDPTAGTLSSPTSNSATVQFAAGIFTVAGTAAEVNAILDTLQFTPTADYSQTLQIQTSVTDGKSTPVVGNAITLEAATTQVNWTWTYFGADTNPNGETAPLTETPNADAARDQFLANLQNVQTQGFEGFANNDQPTTLTFGNETAILTGARAVQDFSTEGVYPNSGDKYLFHHGILRSHRGTNGIYTYSPDDAIKIDFETPQSAFGFTLSDLGDYGSQLIVTLHHTDGSTQDLLVSNNTTAGEHFGKANFFGVTDLEQPFTALTITSTNHRYDGVGIDDLIIGEIKPEVLANPPAPPNSTLQLAYQEDQPLDLSNILVREPGDATVKLTLSDPSAGTLTTGTAAGVTATYDAASGIWTATGDVTALNQLLSEVTFNPAANGSQAVSIATEVSTPTRAPFTGTIELIGLPEPAFDWTWTYFGEDLNPGGNETRLTATPNADGARDAFLANLSNYDVQGFEGFNHNDIPNTFNIGDQTAHFDEDLPVKTSTNGTYGGDGSYPLSGDNFLLHTSFLNQTGEVALTFDAPQTAFGFSAIDMGDAGEHLFLTVEHVDGASNVVSVPHQISGNPGAVNFFGLIDAENPFTAITFNNTKPNEGGWGLDDFILGQVSEDAQNRTEPTPPNRVFHQTYRENQPLDLVDIQVTAPSSHALVFLQLSDPAAGALSIGTSGAVESTYEADRGLWKAEGNVANVNALLAEVAFEPAEGFVGDVMIQTSVISGSSEALTGQIQLQGVAAPTVVEGEFQVNSHTNSAQRDPAIAALKDGSYMVVWNSNNQQPDGSRHGVYGQRLDAGGNRIGEEFPINNYTNGHQIFADVVGLTDGGYVVVWSSEGQDGSAYGIYSQRYNRYNQKVGDERLINKATDLHPNAQHAYQDLASVTATSDGGYMVAWQSNDSDSDDVDIYGRRYDAADDASEIFRLNTTTVGAQSNPALTTLADGSIVATWTSADQDGSGFGVYRRRFAADGSSLDPTEILVNQTTTESQSAPTVATLNNGSYVITWQAEVGDGSGYGIMARQFSATGQPLGDEFSVNSTQKDYQAQPAITALSDGGFAITWQSYGQDGSQYGVYGQRFDGNGNPVGTEFRATETTNGQQRLPAIAGSTLDDSFIVVWQGLDESAEGVLAQRFENEPEPAAANAAPELQVVNFERNAYQHNGGNDPETEGWSGFIHDINVVQSITEADGSTTWQVRDISTINQSVANYVQGVTDLEAMQARQYGWTTSARFRIGQEDDLPGGSIYTSYRDGFSSYTVHWGSENGETLVRLITDKGIENHVLAGVNALEYHTYELVFDPATETADILVDGEAKHLDFKGNTLNARMLTNNHIGRGVYWGSGSSGDTGVSYWQSVEFSINKPEVTQYQPHTITYAELLAASDVTDANGDEISFRIEGIENGELTLNGEAVNPGTTLVGPEDTLAWVPFVAGEDLTGFTVTVTDGQAFSAAVPVTFDVAELPMVTGEFQVNTRTNSEERDPVVTGLADGSYLAVWTGGDGGYEGIFARRFDAGGNPVGNDFLVNNTTPGFQNQPAVATLTDGGYIITWTGADPDGTGIYSRRYNAENQAISGDTLVNTLTAANQSVAAVTGTTDGGYVIAWQTEGANSGIWARRYNAQGQAVSAEFPLDNAPGSEQQQVTLTALPEGGFVATWMAKAAAGHEYDLYSRIYNGADQALHSEPQLVNSTTLESQSAPAVATLTDGYVVAWEAEGADGSSYGIVAQRFANDGSLLGDEFLVNSTIKSHQVKPAIATLSNGELVITWQSYLQDGALYGVYGQRFDALGQKQGAEFPLHETTHNHELFTAIAGSTLADNFLTVWQAPDERYSGIFGQVFANETLSVAANVAPALSQVDFGRQTFSHSGSNDPVTEGWALRIQGVDDGQMLTAAVDDQGVEVWGMGDRSPTSGTYYYKNISLAETTAAREQGWKLSTDLRVLDAADAPDGSIYATYRDGFTAYTITWGSDAEGNTLLRWQTDLGPKTVTLDNVLADEYHNYAFEFDPETDTVSVEVDGATVEQLSGLTGHIASGQSGWNAENRGIAWGSGLSSADVGEAHWQSFDFEILKPEVTQYRPHTISYAELLAASDATDGNGDVLSFRIEGVGDGVLTLNGEAVTVGQTLVRPGDALQWVSNLAGDDLLGFQVSVVDALGAASGQVDVVFDVAEGIATPLPNQTTYYRPSTPYTTPTDSPFQTNHLPNLHIEDFQDNLINSEALTLHNHTHADIITDAGIANDDPLLSGGKALRVNSSELTLDFAQSFTHVGLVITDIDQYSTATIEAFDSQGVSLGQSDAQTFTNAADEFLGISNNKGIASVKITTDDTNGWQVDHIQYG
ncbi:MAG: S8 family serine peptidase [Cyanobacteria bacterium P01_G01_bin.54]